MESETTSGKSCLIFVDNKFSKNHVGKKLTTWRCTNKKCSVSIHTNEHGVVQEQYVAHNHEDKVKDVSVYKFKVSCKRKGDSDFDKPPRKLIRKELQVLGNENEDITHANISAAKQALWRK